MCNHVKLFFLYSNESCRREDNTHSFIHSVSQWVFKHTNSIISSKKTRGMSECVCVSIPWRYICSSEREREWIREINDQSPLVEVEKLSEDSSCVNKCSQQHEQISCTHTLVQTLRVKWVSIVDCNRTVSSLTAAAAKISRFCSFLCFIFVRSN